MSLDSLHDLYVDELKDLYNAETQLLKALPRMARAASAPDLKAAFAEHLEVTRGQVERLDRIFEGLGVGPKGKRCKAMEGLIEEGKEARQVVAPRRGVSALVQIVAPGNRRPKGPMRLVVEAAEGEIGAPAPSREPGEDGIWWTAVDLPFDARRLRAFTEGASATEGLVGELLLTEELLRSGAVLRIELKEHDPALGER